MDQIVIRRARITDLPAIVALLYDDVLGREREDAAAPLNGRYVAAFDAIERDPNQLMAVMTDGDEVIGCLQLTFIPGIARLGTWRGQVENVRIASARRGAGLGRRLMGWAIEECRGHGCGLVQLTADKSRHDAHRFYRSLGFKALHEGMKLEL